MLTYKYGRPQFKYNGPSLSFVTQYTPDEHLVPPVLSRRQRLTESRTELSFVTFFLSTVRNIRLPEPELYRERVRRTQYNNLDGFWNNINIVYEMYVIA